MINPWSSFNATKPKITLGLYMLFLLSYFISRASFNVDPAFLILNSVIVLSVLSGANILNSYLDRDVDSLMARTKRRPIPSGALKPGTALTIGLILLATPTPLLLLLRSIPAEAFLLGLLGLVSYIVAYTMVLKRRTRLNVLATAPAVASPVWYGWMIGRGYLDLQGFILGLLIAIWGPLHFWCLAMVFSEDYRRAKIPMMPLSVGRGKARWHIFILTLLLITTSLTPMALGFNGRLYLAGALLLGGILTYVAVKAFFDLRTLKWYWLLYKLTTPYILGILMVALLDVVSPVEGLILIAVLLTAYLAWLLKPLVKLVKLHMRAG
ncbi:MAG: protoheme IX farnesyltransferase [Candidatus Nezhaarchaeales archaeon]